MITTIVQTTIDWHQPHSNRMRIQQLLSKHLLDTDLIVLPEMFTTGFSMEPQKIAEKNNGQTVQWMTSLAEKYRAVVCGSLVILSDGNYYNRFVWVTSDGVEHYYDKRHTFSLAGEHLKYTSGKNSGIWNYGDWKICARICYDLRFPVWCRNSSDYDLIIFVANWPLARTDAWRSLLKSRAIENMSYCIGVNRIGKDANGLTYLGHSGIYDHMGKRLTPKMANNEYVVTVELDRYKLNLARNRLGFLKDRDRFVLH